MRKSFYLSGLIAFCFILFSVAVKATTTTPGAPAITSNPRDTAVCNGAAVWFAVKANDTLGGDTMTIHYTWEVSTDGGSTWDTVHNAGVYSHATTDTLKISFAAHSMNGYMYMCGATNDSGTTWSDAANLRVDTLFAGTISGTTSVCVGSTTSLASSVTGGTWSNVNHAIDTVDNAGNVYGIMHGFDTVKYRFTDLCGTATSWAVVRVDTIVSNFPITGPTTTCAGNIIDLMNVNVLGDWTWTGSNGTALVNHAGMVEGVSYGIDTVTYTFTNACNSVDTFITVQIDTVLAHGAISGPNEVCAGSWIHLTETTGDGEWLTSNSSVAITDMSGNVTGVSQGVAVISYYLANGCGVSTAMDTIHVYQPADEITGLDSVGLTLHRTLFDSTIGGVWTSSDTLVVRIDSTTGVTTGVATGTAIITYSVTNLCGTSMATLLMHVGPHPSAGAIFGKDSVCIGHTITLSDTLVEGGVWTSANDTIATVDPSSGLVTGIAYGVAHISYTFTNGFGSTSLVTAVFVNRAPHDSLSVPNIFALSGTYTFLGYPTGGTWHTSNTHVGNFIGTPGFFVIYSSGTDTITYSVTNACGTTDTSFIINVPFIAGVNEVANPVAVLNVYPNPSEGDFTINLSSSVTEQAQVTITNMVGKKVKEVSITTNQASVLKLDAPDGIYFLTATTPGGKTTAKITITK